MNFLAETFVLEIHAGSFCDEKGKVGAAWRKAWSLALTFSVAVSPSLFVPALPIPARTAAEKPRAVGTLKQEAYSLQPAVLPSSPFL